MKTDHQRIPENTYPPLVLAIDDNPDNLRVLGNILQENNIQVAVVQDPEKALHFATTQPIDLILLDIMMPGTDGYQVCRKLKATKMTCDIPVIFLTARIDPESIVKGFEAGGVDYVTKPFNSRELLARINTHVRLRRALLEVRALRGLIPICAHCKKVRDDKGFWEQVEGYVEKRSEALFSHTICPACIKEHYSDYMDDEADSDL